MNTAIGLTDFVTAAMQRITTENGFYTNAGLNVISGRHARNISRLVDSEELHISVFLSSYVVDNYGFDNATVEAGFDIEGRFPATGDYFTRLEMFCFDVRKAFTYKSNRRVVPGTTTAIALSVELGSTVIAPVEDGAKTSYWTMPVQYFIGDTYT